MISFIRQGGGFMWPIVIMALVILYLTVKNLVTIYIRKETKNTQQTHSINSILFWGVMCALLGFLGHYWGIYLAMQAISQVSDISPQILAGGYQVSLVTILTGMTLLIFSSVIWFIFRRKVNNTVAA